jgi:acetyltransferase-like isoleucine patch superfamily enzyme
MLNAHRVGNRWRIALRHIALTLLGKLPGTRFKSRLFARLFKIEMGRDVGLACKVLLDPYEPSLISFGDNVIVGYDSKIFVHVFTLDHQRVRPVRIGSNVLIGAFCVIAPGVTIGDGASIAPGTYVTRNVPTGAIVTGNEMRIRRRRTAMSREPTAAD